MLKAKRNKFYICCISLLIVFTIGLLILIGCNRNQSQKTFLYKATNPVEQSSEKILGYSNPEAIISVYELNNILNDPNLVIYDTRSVNQRAFKNTFLPDHIPGARALFKSNYTDPARDKRIARPKQIEMYFWKYQIDNNIKIVIYGNDGNQARFYWMLKMYGCENPVQILDGGIEKWKEAGFETQSSKSVKEISKSLSKFHFNPAKANENFFASLKQIWDIHSDSNNLFIDARSRDEYLAGHIPYSINIGVNDVLNPDKTFKSAQELTAICASKGLTPEKNIIVYSSKGIRSSLIWYVLHELLGYPNVSNYDGGYREWTNRECEVEKGEPQTRR